MEEAGLIAVIVDRDEVYVSQVGPDQEAFFDFFRAEVLPRI